MGQEIEKRGITKVPVFDSWGKWYLLVIAVLLVLIALFYWFTLSFS